MEIVDIRFRGPGTSMADGRGDVRRGGPGKLGKVQTRTVVHRADGRMRCRPAL